MTVNPNHNAPFAPVDFLPALWERWMALRNGELAHVEEIVAPALALHATNGPGRPVWDTIDPERGQGIGQGRERASSRRAMLSWLSATRAALPAGQFTVQVGPIINGGLIAGRWVFSRDDRLTRTVPGNAAVTFTGTDILRVDEGQIVELWINHDIPSHTASLGSAAA